MMAWITADEMMDHTPVGVYDANGMQIYRYITGFDPQTGEVESLVKTKDNHFIEEPEGEFKRRMEFFAAPLFWREISKEELRISIARTWDFKEDNEGVEIISNEDSLHSASQPNR